MTEIAAILPTIVQIGGGLAAKVPQPRQPYSAGVGKVAMPAANPHRAHG